MKRKVASPAMEEGQGYARLGEGGVCSFAEEGGVVINERG